MDTPRKCLRGAVLLVVLVGCGSPGGEEVRAAGPDGSARAAAADTDGPSGRVRVQLEPVDGYFAEGFEVGLRFEGPGGEDISSLLWTDYVESTGSTDLDAYYDTVLDQPVPGGSVTVRGEVTIGPAGPPPVPDLEGDLPCRLDVEVGAGRTVDVEVRFDAGDECLAIIEDPDTQPTPPTTTSVPATPPTTITPRPRPSTSDTAPGTTTRPAPVPEPEPGPGPGPGPGGADLPIGSTHSVDVDLRCQAFDLAGLWVLVEGDTSDWQPPGERHEGGTFTIDGPDTGTFRGDADGRKTATFRQLEPDDEPACIPLPR